MSYITELRQTGENKWVAKYQGNYGIYTIRITTDGKKTETFSCSCPSGYSPCKHISIIEKAIAEKIAGKKNQENRGEVRIEDLVRAASAEKLQDFIITQSKYNPELFNAVFLEFTTGKENEETSTYHALLRNTLSLVSLDDFEPLSDGGETIDVLSGLLDKARECVQRGQCDKAILICKACIEEYSAWLDTHDDEEISYILSSEYQSAPFKILEDAAHHTDKKELFDYCMSESEKEKYTETYFYDYFQKLLARLAPDVDPDAFIALQDKLLEGLTDKSSYMVKKILQRKIDVFTQSGQEDKARLLLEENIQIDSFRMEVVKRNIKEGNLLEAKKLIVDYFKKNEENGKVSHNYLWKELLLEIAQKEKDIPAVRELAYGLIEHHFMENFFTIYKEAFSPAEWPAKREELLAHYDKGEYSGNPAAELLKTEKDAAGLLDYIERHSSLQMLEDYYQVFSPGYPERTLALFQNAVTAYAENRTGRNNYEYIVTILQKMLEIKGGKAAVAAWVEDYKYRYKTRKAMLEILNRFQQQFLVS